MKDYDFYTCKRCGRLITDLEMNTKISGGKVCPCGGLRYSPTNMRWFHWFLPRVWVFAVQRIRGVA